MRRNTPGSVTATKPYAPNHLVYVGIVERANNGNGELYVKIQNGYELEELHNVAISSVANADLLAYESSTSLWKNKSIGTLGLETSSHASSTYQTISGMSAYLTTSSASSMKSPIRSESTVDRQATRNSTGCWAGS